jgi:rubrerythrin
VKGGREAVEVLVKGISIWQKLDEMSMEEKRKVKRESESVEVYVERMKKVQENAIVTAIKWIEEQ